MPVGSDISTARASATSRGDELEVVLAGTWQVTEPRPNWAEVRGEAQPKRVRVRAEALGRWDTSLLLFLLEIEQWCSTAPAEFDPHPLPAKMQTLLEQISGSHRHSSPKDRSDSFLATVGFAAQQTVQQVREFFHFVGEVVLSVNRLVRSPRKFRWSDCLAEAQQCGAMALPIVSLVAFLIGVTLAYTAAVVLRQFGGDIFIADLIGLAMFREVGAVMTAVVLSGRTGAAFAATLANMKMNEEIDALETLGIPAVQFLVLPRLLAIGIMMPLLTMYANALGVIGGMVVAYGLLAISPTAYWVEMLTIVDLSDVLSGVIKAIAFGLIVGLSGCLRGLQSERSAAGVGRAATSAVVTAILLMVIADAIFAVLFNVLGI